ncbi:MAG: universal stress protein [Deltaproteobacteria bacterium]|jgi:nucleotide-binding universal stress UspA family protein
MVQKILFGVDDSNFAIEALAAAGSLVKSSKSLKIILFHGIPDPNISFLSRVLHLSPESLEKYRELSVLEEQRALDRAKELLIASGVGADRIGTLLEEKCNDVAEGMLKSATSEGFETLALARWGATTVGRQVMGSVTYRLAQMADNLPLWIVDPRIPFRDVLVTLVGAPISHRVMDHAVRYFAHLKESRFTFFHVIPPLPPRYWDYSRSLKREELQEIQEEMDDLMKEYTAQVENVMHEGKERLVDAGVPTENVVFKVQAQERGIARDILAELEQGRYGVLLTGRKGSRDISGFGLGSKANKLLHGARALVICLVN